MRRDGWMDGWILDWIGLGLVFVPRENDFL